MEEIRETEEIQRQYFTIGEVAKELGLTTSLIRFWETEFREINPKKNRKGNRVYTRKDIETLRRIHYLLKVKKYTIKGAKERLKTSTEDIQYEVKMRETLIKLRTFLLELKESL
ncbi:MAG: MerR family transcriptional regulator [Bacteroidota bacterium]